MNQNTINKLWAVVEPKFQREFDVRGTLSTLGQNKIESTGTRLILTNNSIVWASWGVNPKTICSLGGKCLVFKPNGRYFKGFVCVTLGWEDLYQVHFVDNNYKLKKSVDGVYFDMLVGVIDAEVETR
jgi:hypothetical protein